MAKLSSTQIYGDLQVDGEIKNKATTEQEGVVQLNDNVNSTSTTQGATANAVKKVNDSLSSHKTDTTSHITASERTTWNNKLDKTGGTVSGNLYVNGFVKHLHPSTGVDTGFDTYNNTTPMIRTGGNSNLDLDVRGVSDAHRATFKTTGDFYAGKDLYANNGSNKVYHTGNKPTPADIGASPTSHTHNNIVSRGVVAMETGANSRPAVEGVSLSQVYNNGYPTSYGNVVSLRGGGDGQILVGWSGASGATAPVYVRSRRDTTDADWSAWAMFYTSANPQTTITGNASTATTLQTARTLTIGNTGKSFNGSANVSWSLDEIGAVPLTTGGNTTIIADSDASTTSEYIMLKAGHNELKLTSSGGGTTVTKGQDKLTLNGNAVYHTGNKPTPADIGASASTHTHNYAGSSSAGGSATTALTCTGNSATATLSSYLNSNSRMDYGWNGANYFNISGTAGSVAKANDTPTTAWWHMMRFNHANSAGFYTDLAIPFNDVSMYYKRVTSGAVQNGGWVKMLDSLNYTSYVPTKTGSGASGTWGISVTGNSATATKLQTARTINGVSFDGTANITIADSTKLPLTGGTISGELKFSSAYANAENGIEGGNGDAASFATCNLDIFSWNGIGFYPKAGGVWGNGKAGRSVVIDPRTGYVRAKGGLEVNGVNVMSEINSAKAYTSYTITPATGVSITEARVYKNQRTVTIFAWISTSFTFSTNSSHHVFTVPTDIAGGALAQEINLYASCNGLLLPVSGGLSGKMYIDTANVLPSNKYFLIQGVWVI